MGRMSDVTYTFFGKVLPERALIEIREVLFEVSGSDDVPEGQLYVAILKSQIIARYVAATAVGNVFSLRNMVDDAVRRLLDAVGYVNGWAYDIDIIEAVRSIDRQTWVFGIDIPALNGVAEKAGVAPQDVITMLNLPQGWAVRQAMADVREAMKSSTDTGLFCYRAIESLKQGFAERMSLDPDRTWEDFRNAYGIAKDDIMLVKGFADAARHGAALQTSISDADRASIFTTTWKIVNAFILVEKVRIAKV